MVIEVLVFAAVAVATASADVVLLPTGISYPTGLAYSPPVVPAVYVTRALPITTSRQADADPLETFAHGTNKAFNEKHEIKPQHHYSYGYETYDWQTKLSTGLHETRYGDTAVGTAYKVTPERNRTTVKYTVDSTNGFQSSVLKDVQTQRNSYGYGRMGGRMAYNSLPAPEEYASNKTVLKNEEDIENSNPYVQYAHKIHKIVMKHLRLEPPINIRWGYEIKDTETGHSRSQYASYHGDTAEGRYTEVKGDGTEVSFDYTIVPQGFAVTTPVETVTPVVVPVYPGFNF